MLGLIIWQQCPESAFWVIGLFVGINLEFRGLNWIGLGLSLRTLLRAAIEAGHLPSSPGR